MIKKVLIFLTIILTLTTLSSCQNINDKKDISNQKKIINELYGDKISKFDYESLMEDYEQLYSLINIYHTKLFTDEEELKKIYEEGKNRIYNNMTEVEFLRVVAPMISILNCGHSVIYYSNDTYEYLLDKGKFIPLELEVHDNNLYVIDNALSSSIPIGSKIIEINNNKSDDIVNRIYNNLSSDGENLTTKKMVINQMFSYLYHSYIEVAETFDITYQEYMSDDIYNIIIEAATLQTINNETKRIVDDIVPYKSEFNDSYAILDMNSFYPYSPYTIGDYKQFIDQFFLEVKNKEINKVILDLRDNGGGDPIVSSHLYSYLAKYSKPYFHSSAPNYYRGLKDEIELAENRFNGDLIVLMDGGSFSSTGHLLALLKNQDVGTYVGEESGGSYACSDSSRNFSLDNTKLRLRLSTQVWKVDVDNYEHGIGILPDHFIEHTIDDVLNNEDSIIEFAIDLLDIEQ